MRLSTAEEMVISDRKMAEKYGVPTLILMEHAALCVLSEMEKRMLLKGKIAIVCGKGNNGGDGYALARLLFQRGCDVTVINAFSTIPSSEDAAVNYKICRNIGVCFGNINNLSSADVVVDALFGTGLNKKPDDFCTDIIKSINKSDAYIISVDIPSGAYANSSFQQNLCVNANLTVTFASYKPSLVFYPSAETCGEIVCCDIGITDDCFQGNSYVIDSGLLRKSIPPRCPFGHKGTFGRVLGIGGSTGLSGAIFMCGQAAMKSGCGTVKLCVPESISTIMETKTTEVMTVCCPDDQNGCFSESSVGELLKNVSEADCVVFGCGIGRFPSALSILERILEYSSVPVIIDADGIYALAKKPDVLKNAQCPVIITPHLGEMAKLYDVSIDELQAQPIEIAKKFAEKYGVILCLKSGRTVIASPNGGVFVNVFGNNGMAKGGSGDCLAGIIASFAAQGADALDAAISGVGIHALAGDMAAEKLGEYSITPLDLIDNIGIAIKKVL